MQSLLNIPNPSNTLNSLRTFHDSIESHSRGLSSLGKPEEAYGDQLVPIILGKMPSDIRQNLARESTTLKWTFPQLKLAILKEIQILESGSSHSYLQLPFWLILNSPEIVRITIGHHNHVFIARGLMQPINVPL